MLGHVYSRPKASESATKGLDLFTADASAGNVLNRLLCRELISICISISSF